MVKLPDKSCREDHGFLIIARDHNEDYSVPPRLSPPVMKETLNHRRVSFRVAILQ